MDRTCLLRHPRGCSVGLKSDFEGRSVALGILLARHGGLGILVGFFLFGVFFGCLWPTLALFFANLWCIGFSVRIRAGF